MGYVVKIVLVTFNSKQGWLVTSNWAPWGFPTCRKHCLSCIICSREKLPLVRNWTYDAKILKAKFLHLEDNVAYKSTATWESGFLLPEFHWVFLGLQYEFQRKCHKRKIFIELAFTCYTYLIIHGRLISMASASCMSKA